MERAEKEFEIGCFVVNVRDVCKMMTAENAAIAKIRQSLEDKIDYDKNVFTGAAKWIHIEKETQQTTITAMVTLGQPMDLFRTQYLQ